MDRATVLVYAWVAAAILAPIAAILAASPSSMPGAAGTSVNGGVRVVSIVEFVKPSSELVVNGRVVGVEDPVSALLLWVLAEASNARCLGCGSVPCGNLTLVVAGTGGVWMAPATVSWNTSGVIMRGELTAPFHMDAYLVGIFVFNDSSLEPVAYTLGNWSITDGSLIDYEVFLNTTGTSLDPEALSTVIREALACRLGGGSSIVTISSVNVTVRPVAYSVGTSGVETNETIVTPVGNITVTASGVGACVLAYPFATSSYWRVVSIADGYAWLDRAGFVNGTSVIVYKVAYPCVDARVYT